MPEFQMIDMIVFLGILAIIIAVGLSFTQKAGKSLTSFFLGGRSFPWYIAGISMVATTFAADTPLAVTELTYANGISGNWFWWCFLAGGMLTTFFFANLWRRAEVLTEVELIELRYDGKAASFLRGFKAVYLGLFLNVLIIGWVNLALMTLLEVFFGLSSSQALMYTAITMVFVSLYASASGLLGVAITDMIQFCLAMVGCIILAILVINSNDVGGIDGLKASLPTGTLDFFPKVAASADEQGLGTTLALGIGAFLAYSTVMWWASWYPGAEPGGGGYVAQRMMSAKDEKNAVYATLFFQIAHYCIRPWPWILVALASISLYGLQNQKNFAVEPALYSQYQGLKADLGQKDAIFTMDDAALQKMAEDNDKVKANLSRIMAFNAQLRNSASKDVKLEKSLAYVKDSRKGFVFAMKDYLNMTGLKGLLLAAFFAAYMSTISTQLNWGASYLVNDLYHRFIDPTATQEKLVKVARGMTLLLMVIGLIVSSFITSISGVWGFIIECGAGLGLVLILRWYWWRINAWSEIAATVTPFIVFAACKLMGIEFPNSFFITVGLTTITWLAVTYFTPATNMEKLKAFYCKVQPDGRWGVVRQLTNLADKKSNLAYLFLCWLSAIMMTYGILFASGYLLFKEWNKGLMALAFVIVGFILLRIGLKKTRILAD